MSWLDTWPIDADLQTPFDAAVVIPTIGRVHLKRALQSVYAQDFPGRIHLLIGMDKDSLLPCPEKPDNVTVQILWPGFSTSTRHGGLTPSGDGGALRTILTYLANSPYVAYLDDDNWWATNHLSTLRSAIEGVDWAYSQRWFVHPETSLPLAVDRWESCGPGRGLRTAPMGGFVDPSSLMIDKTKCRSAPQCWTFPAVESDPMSSDCTVVGYLTQMHISRGTNEPTSFYTMNSADPFHPKRLEWIGADVYEEAGRMPDNYMAAMAARVAAYRQRKDEQAVETNAARDTALAEAERYMAALDINLGRLLEVQEG